MIIINNCRNEIKNTQLYKSLSEKSKNNLEKEIFEKCNFQLFFDNDNKITLHVGWDQVRSLCGLNANSLDGIYKYTCNMAHPSYLALTQFRNVFNSADLSKFKITAIILQITLIMSVFIIDYINSFQEIKYVYDNLDSESKYMVARYDYLFRKNI